MTETKRRNGGEPARSEPDPRAVGKRIAIARKEAGGMTQGELADALQVSKRSVAAYEAGAVLPLRHLGRIETALSKPKAWLLYGDEALPNPSALLARLDGVLDEIAKRMDALDDRVDRLPAPRDGDTHRGDGAARVDDLNRLVELRYQEMISEAEFAAAKALLFGLDRTAG